ncbi:MAG: hypothetical protein HQM15_10665 [Deltaproteobacteria bacterium]|nr:hypothetical protein [Deltaproteobacteria bacterium]
MSKALSLKLEEDLFLETEKLLKEIQIPRNTYINKAVSFFNQCTKKKMIKKKLKREALLLQSDTREFLKDFELLEDLPE